MIWVRGSELTGTFLLFFLVTVELKELCAVAADAPPPSGNPAHMCIGYCGRKLRNKIVVKGLSLISARSPLN